MSRCYTCGNEYENTFRIQMSGQNYDFDCFECAVHALAPTCSHCGCRILGHGVQFDEVLFCCAHCAKEAGVAGLSDHGHTSVIAEASL